VYLYIYVHRLSIYILSCHYALETTVWGENVLNYTLHYKVAEPLEAANVENKKLSTSTVRCGYGVVIFASTKLCRIVGQLKVFYVNTSFS
jgi:hypothetical protein